MLSFSFEMCFSQLWWNFSKCSLKRIFLDIYLTTSLVVRKFKNTSAMRVILFLKMYKIESKFRKWKKNWDNIFRFWDNCVWKCCYKLSLLRTEYLLSGVNRLTNSPMILHITKRDFFNLSCLWFVFTGINKYGKGGVVQLRTLFQLVYHVTCRKVLWNVTF